MIIRPELKKQVDDFYRQHPDEARESFGNDPFEVKNLLKHWVFSDKKELNVIPTDTIHIAVDKEALLRSDIRLPHSMSHLKGEELKDALPDKMQISLKGIRYLTKSDARSVTVRQ